jgi:sirohydrochlorin ferrochelatase
VSPKNPSEAITFVAHGSGLEGANKFVLGLINQLASDKPINLGFLEMAEPSLAQALTHHGKSGQKVIRVIPLFLAPGKHTLIDIPAIAAQITAEFPDTRISFDPFIGAHANFLALLKNCL